MLLLYDTKFLHIETVTRYVPPKNNVMNVMDVMMGCFECFCSFNKKVYPVPVSANLLIA